MPKTMDPTEARKERRIRPASVAEPDAGVDRVAG
jgi:hypothetical protein